jgi:hypothetical protein
MRSLTPPANDTCACLTFHHHPTTNQAHFSIKPEWLEGQYVNSMTYSDLVFGATNELDWPHKSWCLACSSLDRLIKKERS